MRSTIIIFVFVSVDPVVQLFHVWFLVEIIMQPCKVFNTPLSSVCACQHLVQYIFTKVDGHKKSILFYHSLPLQEI